MSIKAVAKGFLKCGFKFLKYNYFSKRVARKKGAYFFPYRNSIIEISKTGRLILNGSFEFNASKFKHSKAESYLRICPGATMIVNGDSRINYGSTINVNDGAVLEIGSMTSNVGINFQCRKKITIGNDCMFGRNSTIFDSSFHPTGYSLEEFKTNSEEVKIGNHVWVGAYAFVMQGTELKDGAIVGSKAYVRGETEPASLIMTRTDKPSATGMMWARGDNEALKQNALAYYKTEEKPIVDNQAVAVFSKRILDCLNREIDYLDLKSTDDLVENGKLDSLTTISVVIALDKEFGVNIPYNEIKPSSLRNVASMATMMGKLLDEAKATDADLFKMPDRAFPKVSVVEQIFKNAARHPEKIAIIAENKEYTYSNLSRMISGYAAYLKSLGLKKGEMILARASQTINYIVVYFASHLAGLEITSVEKNASKETLYEMAKKVFAKAVLTRKEDFASDDAPFSFLDSRDVLNHVDSPLDNPVFPKESDLADVLFTTGTTGTSKGIELTHKGVVCGAENMAIGAEMSSRTFLICPNPLSHSNAIKNLAAVMISGGTFYVLDGISNLNSFFKALDYPAQKVSLVLPPAGIRTIFQLAKDKFASYKDKIEYLMAATAPLPEPDRETLRLMFPRTKLFNHYGCSESSTISIYDFNKYKDLLNCVGKATPNTNVMFVDEHRKAIQSSKDNMGLLAVSGGAVMVGYYKDEKATSEVLIDGVVYTNDVGYVDGEGFVFITGRSDDVINVGGLKVAPTEVESAAMENDSVSDCICIGTKDETTGQALKLLVVPARKFSSVDGRNLIAYLSTKLEAYKVPRIIEIVDHIERTYNGKLNRKAYR